MINSMRNEYKKFIILVVAVIIAVALGLFAQHNHYRALIYENAKKMVGVSLDVLNEEIEGWLSQQSQVIHSAGQFIELKDWDRKDVLAYLKALQNINPDFASLYFVSAGNEMFNSRGWQPPAGLDLRKRPWYIAAISKNRLIITEAFLNASKDDVIVTIAKPLYNAQGTLIGVLGGDVSVRTVMKLVSRKKVDETGFSFLLDGNNRMLAWPDLICEFSNGPMQLGEEYAFISQLQAQGPNAVVRQNLQGRDGFVAYQRINNTSWILGSFVSIDDYFKTKEQMTRGFLLVLATSVFILMCLFGFFTRYVIRPLACIHEGIGRIDVKERSRFRLPVAGHDKFSGVARLINNLIDKAEAYHETLENTVQERTQELQAQNEEIIAMIEEISSLNQMLTGMNNSLEQANRTLAIEVDIRKQKEQELMRREKQYWATTGLITNSAEDVHELLELILHEAITLVGAPGGYIGLIDASGGEIILRHTSGANRVFQMQARSTNEGLLSEVCRSGEIKYVENYCQYPYPVREHLIERLTTVLMMPLKQAGAVKGVLVANWQDDVHPITSDELESFQQFGNLTSIALERAYAGQKISYQNLLLQKLAETSASLVNELDIDKVLQNILYQATSFMGIPDGFIQLFEKDGKSTLFKCVSGRYESMNGMTINFGGKGIMGEILRNGRPVVINDYANWPHRLAGEFVEEVTAIMQAPLNIEGETIGSIGMALFEKSLVIEAEKLAIFEQFATIAAIAVKNALSHQKTKYQALHDSLTGLPNRAYLNIRLKEETEKARSGEYSGAIFFIDLDDLKTVNDSLGHSCGDRVIMAVAEKIGGIFGPETFMARVGGDEFVAILSGEADRNHIANIARQLVSDSQREYEVAGRKIHMSASVGVALYPDDGENAEDILKNADKAMYAAKSAGRNCWRFYEPAMFRDAYAKLIMTNSLRNAQERGELSLHYQPMVSLKEGNKVIGFEALLRWNSLEHGLVSPTRFIPLAEQSGLIHSIGQWVTEEACRFARKLSDMGHQNVHVAVNVSPCQLVAKDFIDMVHRCIYDTGIKPEQLELEMTENIFIESLEDATRILVELSALGVRLSLDDFGTGFSSLTYLLNLPVGTLKIDKRFIDKILENKIQEGLTRSIIDMAHVMKLKVVAEGVETESQLEKLNQSDCDYVQGYWFSRPMPEEEAIRFLIHS